MRNFATIRQFAILYTESCQYGLPANNTTNCNGAVLSAGAKTPTAKYKRSVFLTLQT